ncbi:MAG: prepilin peptidase [Rickettsiales bacterium]|jgi:leader peptidase (prepilin peptidase) / N-methyltransferase|nr:prepilin peptidase [Rickettsiales bacterium]
MNSVLLTFIIGTIFGSFASLLSYRIPIGKDIFISRSSCTKCNNKLGFWQLFPLISYLWQKGKCKFCNEKISLRYPIIEFLCGMIFMFTYMKFGYSHANILIFLTFFTLLVASLIDIKTYEVPLKLQIILLVFAISFGLVNNYSISQILLHPLYIYVAGISLKYAFYFIRGKDGLGLADINLAFIVTIFIGIENFAYFMFLSGVIGVISGLIWQRLYKQNLFPFFPALSIAFLICYGIL